MLIELEQDGTHLGVVSRPAFIDPGCVICIVQYEVNPAKTRLVFANGQEMCVLGECKDIGRQIQDGLKPPIDLRTFEPSSMVPERVAEALSEILERGQDLRFTDAIRNAVRDA